MALNNGSAPPFKLVHGYEKRYLITRQGIVFDFLRGKIVARYERNGYISLRLFNGKRSRGEYLHRLLAEAFLPNPKKYPCINHKNGNKLDNDLRNLEWCNYSYNIKHAYSTGLKTGSRGRTPIRNYLVECIDDGRSFGTIGECCAFNQINYGALYRHLRGLSKTCGGKRYKKIIK